MLFLNRLLLVGLLSVGITAATTAQAGNQLFTGSWTVKAMGNELTGGAGASAVYSAFGIPQGIQCNANQPRCPFQSTPTDGIGGFDPRGGYYPNQAPLCANLSTYGGGTTVRPAKGATLTTGGLLKRRIPPLYRNPVFFTPSGQPGITFCTGTSTGATPGGKGLVQAGQPVTGTWGAATTGIPGKGGFSFVAAPANGAAGVRTTGLAGSFPMFYPHAGSLYPPLYRYSYATLRNDQGVFGPGKGPGNFTIQNYAGAFPVATIKVKQGAAKFGGTMRMLGALTVKGCNFRFGPGCWFGENTWHYEAVGAAPYTLGGVVTQGHISSYTAFYYHWGLMQETAIFVEGSRFPWTTGSVTVKATGRGPHKTVHYAQGYDNRTTTVMDGVTNVRGTIQLVSPVLTRWLSPFTNFETGGVAILRIKFVPEPQMWATLVAGVLLLGVATRMRAR